MKITFDLWRRFEEVVSYAINDIIEEAQLTTIQQELTEPSHDGGYDGSFLIPVISNVTSNDMGGCYKILFEAKLRSNSSKDLPLQDFSKALIIAINVNADALIVATNLYLTENTKEHLKDFSEKTNLQTYYLSPHYINNWLLNHFTEETKTLDEDIRGLLNKTLNRSNIPPVIETLRKEHSPIRSQLPELIGTKRKHLLEEISGLLNNSYGLVLIEGKAGVGKTFFCSHLSEQMNRNGFIVYSIDVEHYQTPRVLFLKLLGILWHIPFDALLTLNRDYLESVISHIDSGLISGEVKEAVLAAFLGSIENYNNNADVFNYCLIKYLMSVYEIRIRRSKIILYFSNINSVTPQLADFILLFLRHYLNNGRAILELRTSTYIDTYMTADQWDNYVKQFRMIDKLICQRIIEEFSETDGYQFIHLAFDKIVPGTPLIKAILHITGNNPLMISSLIEYLNFSDMIQKLTQDVIIQKLDQIIIDDKRQIITLLIETFCRKNPFYANFFEIIRIFRIPVKEEFIKHVLSDYNVAYIDELVNAKLFCRIGGELSVVHPYQLNCILKNHSLMDYSQRCLAQSILDSLDYANLESDHDTMVRIRLYQILNLYQDIVKVGYLFVTELHRSGQYKLFYEYGELVLDYMEILNMNSSSLQYIHLLLLLINGGIYLEEDTIQSLPVYMEKLEEAINEYPVESADISEFIHLKTSYYKTKNCYEHFNGEFDKAYNTLTEALEYTEKYKDMLGENIVGNIQLEYSIALKEKESLTQSINYLLQCLEKQPGNPELQFTYHTQMYELKLYDDPEEALAHININMEICSKLATATLYHNRLHWANAQYYLGKNDICFTSSLKYFKETGNLGLKNEEGRFANLIGNIYLQKNDYKNARLYYQYGIDLFQGKAYISNLWPLLINMTTLLTIIHASDVRDYLYKSIDILYKAYGERIKSSNVLPGHYEALHTAVAILYYNFRKSEHLFGTSEIQEFLHYFGRKLLTNQKREVLYNMPVSKIKEYLNNTPHYCGQYVLLGY